MTLNQEKITLISSKKNWIEQAAVDQLNATAKLPGVVRAVGLPDLHPGKTPVGLALLSEGRIYPHIIGNDIGCGMGLYITGIKQKRFKQDKWVTRLNSIRDLGDLEADNPFEEESPIRDLGTIGSGNHFAEFQCVEQVYDKEVMENLGISKDQIYLFIHSGSRGYGQQILSGFPGTKGLTEGSREAGEYLALHENALLWASINRELTARKLLGFLGVKEEVQLLLESCHNYVERTKTGWLHRKGSVSAKHGAVMIPGSRGSFTYLCVPRKNTEISLNSISHGAGRKWARSICKSRIDKKYDRDSIRSTDLKSRVVCHDTNLLYAEAPEAYKNVEQVLKSLMEYELIDIAATFRPLITYKG